MKIKQTVTKLILGALLLVGLALPVLAATPADAASCGGVQTSIISCEQDGKGDEVEDTGVWGILLLAINILTAGIGIVAVAGVVYASILYTTAGGSSDQTKKAMTIIADIVIGVVAYALMYAVLNFLVPGGLFT